MNTPKISLAAFFALATLAISPCRGTELLTNGNFETGTFAGWTTANQAGGNGAFFVDTPGATTPISGFGTAANPSGGSHYAVTDQPGAGTHALLQTFTVPSVPVSLTVTFQMFVNNSVGTTSINPAGLDYTAQPNQQARVDILTGSASAFDTGAGVIRNLYTGTMGGGTHGYMTYSFDITADILAAGNYQLRFAESDNQGVLNLGVDNASVSFTSGPAAPATVPDTGSTLALLLVGAGLLAGVERLYRARLA